MNEVLDPQELRRLLFLRAWRAFHVLALLALLSTYARYEGSILNAANALQLIPH